MHPALRSLLACAFALAPLLAGAQPVPGTPCAKGDTPCLLAWLRNHASHQFDTWKDLMARPLAERIEPAPAMLVEYLNVDNAVNGWPDQPRAGEGNARFVAEVKAAIADLPQAVNLLFVDKLVGIFLVRDLGGTGFTDFVTDAAGHPVAGFIVLDEGVLQRFTANEWATWKENTPFQPDPAWRLAARIAEGPQDNRRNAIQYILLHELGHVWSIGGIIHPPWQLPPKEVGDTAGYEFFNLSWRVDAAANRFTTPFDEAFPLRTQVAYYFGAKLAGRDMAPAYAQLARTNFPSLYAATRPGDDFAESFASYVHVVLMHKPWEVAISRGGETVQVFRACWDEERCAAKRKLLEGIAGRP